MRIGINLVGVSYNDGSIGRYRNYEDALDGFMTNIVNPLKEEGHDIFFYLFTYDSVKKEDILKTYNPVKSTFLDPNYNKMGGGDRIENQMKIISLTYINALNELNTTITIISKKECEMNDEVWILDILIDGL